MSSSTVMIIETKPGLAELRNCRDDLAFLRDHFWGYPSKRSRDLVAKARTEAGRDGLHYPDRYNTPRVQQAAWLAAVRAEVTKLDLLIEADNADTDVARTLAEIRTTINATLIEV